MNIQTRPAPHTLLQPPQVTTQPLAKPPATLLNPPKQNNSGGELRETFDEFVGEVFYGQMLKSMRQTVGKPAYFHGGRAEEIFQGQLDQVLSEKMTKAGVQFTDPMFELFNVRRS